MSIRLFLLALLLSGTASCAVSVDSVAPQDVDLSGTWKLNPALSDDVEHMLAQRQRKQREEYLKRRRQFERMYPPDAPRPIDIYGTGSPRNEPSASRRASIKRYQENLQQMLAISDTLTIRQQGSTVEIVSAVESRRLIAGSRTQVSMPEGELADSTVGWDGSWFVIDRNVYHGPHVVERYRLLPKTDQLEYEMKWSGESELAGMRITRVFDRSTAPPPPPADPADGPTR